MLFHAPEFLFIFLPITWCAYTALVRLGAHAAGIWILLGASLVFYAAWNVAFLPLIAASIIGNFAVSRLIGAQRVAWAKRLVLGLGVAANLGALGYYKYTNFFLSTLNDATGWSAQWQAVILPIGISFFTFQQIAFLVDTFRNRTDEPSFPRYALFISFFPQLIAGPIVHHSEMMPQFHAVHRPTTDGFAAGLTLLVIGLFKKVVIADTVAVASTAVFSSVAAGVEPSFAVAWSGALCYTAQIYYDFSAYSDMAVGLGMMFGINLPINFASPYRARSIAEFWRRWHITLSRFLRDYLYIPLGGNRRGRARRAVNLFMTMLLGGIWHGAGWTFALWGALHGLFLLVNHWWSGTRFAHRFRAHRWSSPAAWVVTFLCVVLAWVPFRADDLETAARMWAGMLGINAWMVTPAVAQTADGLAAAAVLDWRRTLLAVFVLAFASLAPNAYEIMARAALGTPTSGYPATSIRPSSLACWSPNLVWSIVIAAALLAVLLKIHDPSEFIYFQF